MPEGQRVPIAQPRLGAHKSGAGKSARAPIVQAIRRAWGHDFAKMPLRSPLEQATGPVQFLKFREDGSPVASREPTAWGWDVEPEQVENGSFADAADLDGFRGWLQKAPEKVLRDVYRALSTCLVQRAMRPSRRARPSGGWWS